MAGLFASKYKGQFCYDHAEKEWYRFVGHYWKRASTDEQKIAIRKIREKCFEEMAAAQWGKRGAVKSRDHEALRDAEDAEKLF